MRAAKKRGKHVGRPKALSPGQVQHMHELLNSGKTQAEVGALLGVSANTIERELRKNKMDK
ncbi:helix-turn-helix domain-containing protein [Methyloprofundus sp.]|uniref:helix-turn-helix domain-containing protein n=1 Tax=Methyloprofundus sp. TaxID=2020875 RepID=UPI003D0C5BF1